MLKDSFKEYFKELIGVEEAEGFFRAIAEKTLRRSLRVNDLRSSKSFLKKWLKEQGYSVRDNEFVEMCLDIDGRGKPLALKLPYYSGFTYPQDSSSAFAVDILDPKPGETVLDLTAAPGGKTTFIAQKMKNRGVLVANDMDSKRLKALHSNLERLGVLNTVVFRSMPHKLVEYYPETFDRILLDPSCSGEGLLVTRDGKPNFWSSKSIKRYSAEQYGLLKSAFKLLKPGGRLVYSTCSLNAVENDGVVQRLLSDYPEARIDELDGSIQRKIPKQIGGLLGIRFWPQFTNTKGFFCIAITKNESMNLEPTSLTSHSVKVLKNRVKIDKFLKSKFGIELSDVAFTERDDNIFMVSKELASFSLPPFYSLSFPLLKIYSGGFRLTHAGSLFIWHLAKKGLLHINREQVEAFFARQPIGTSDMEQDIYLADFEYFPLGTAKITGKGIEIVMPRQF